LIGVSESVAFSKTNFLKTQIFKPRLSGQTKDRANSATETKNCHVSQLQKATIDALIA